MKKQMMAMLLALCLVGFGGAGPSGVTVYAAGETEALYVGTDTFSAGDPLLGRQWALYNDGSFALQEQARSFPALSTLPGHTVRVMAQSGAVPGIDINVQQAWQLYEGKREVIVALVDTGVDYTHEELSHGIWVNTDEIPENGIDDDGNGYIDDVYGWNFYSNNNQVFVGEEDDHGTHCAGTIIAQADNGVGIAGIVPGDQVKVMAVKALGGSEGSGSTAAIIQAIRYAEANGASICNLSLGSYANDPALYQAMAESSMLFVVAAGNNGVNTDRTPCYPACYDLENIITVGNLDPDGTLHESSNYGALSVDLAAPGSYILSTTTNGGYGYMTGSSMAAPMVSAAAAMVYSHYEDITLSEVKTILLASAQRLAPLRGVTATGGILDLGAALSCDLESLDEPAPPAMVNTVVHRVERRLIKF